jgi:hypothetical protein
MLRTNASSFLTLARVGEVISHSLSLHSPSSKCSHRHSLSLQEHQIRDLAHGNWLRMRSAAD